MQSVSGGSHWGGGVFIHAQDQARIGLLLLRGGVWEGRRILSEEWIARMRVPCPLYPQYGYLWWLNTGRALFPSASEASYCASGAGGNLTWIDPDNDLVAVMRWIDPAARDGFMRLVMARDPRSSAAGIARTRCGGGDLGSTRIRGEQISEAPDFAWRRALSFKALCSR